MPTIEPFKAMDESGTGAATYRSDISIASKNPNGLWPIPSIHCVGDTTVGETVTFTFLATNRSDADAPNVGDAGWVDVTAQLTAVGSLGAQSVDALAYANVLLRSVKLRVKAVVSGGGAHDVKVWLSEADTALLS